MSLKILDQYIKLRYGTFNQLCKICLIDTKPDYLDKSLLIRSIELKIDEYTEYRIFKRPSTNSIICLSPDSKIYDLTSFHPAQISLMKIQYNTFEPDFVFDPVSIDQINTSYIFGMMLKIRDICVNIISNLNPDSTQIIHINTFNEPFYELIELKDCDNYSNYYYHNIKHCLDMNFDLETSYCIINIIKNAFTFVHFNFAFLVSQHKFYKAIIHKIIEFELATKQLLEKSIKTKKETKEDIYISNILSYLKLNSIMTKLKFKFATEYLTNHNLTCADQLRTFVLNYD
jgi:hypothetical protein